jgi:hypothetical protein
MLIYPYPGKAQTKNSNNTNPEAFACVSSRFFLNWYNLNKMVPKFDTLLPDQLAVFN